MLVQGRGERNADGASPAILVAFLRPKPCVSKPVPKPNRLLSRILDLFKPSLFSRLEFVSQPVGWAQVELDVELVTSFRNWQSKNSIPPEGPESLNALSDPRGFGHAGAKPNHLPETRHPGPSATTTEPPTSLNSFIGL